MVYGAKNFWNFVGLWGPFGQDPCHPHGGLRPTVTHLAQEFPGKLHANHLLHVKHPLAYM